MEPGFCKIDRLTRSLADSPKIVEILSLRGERLHRATAPSCGGALRKITDEVGETRDRDHADAADGVGVKRRGVPRTLSSTASMSRWQARLRPGLPLRRGSDIPPACPRRAPPSPHRATDEHAPLGNGMVQLRADFNLNNISGSECVRM
jgi:hypothetical protein